MQTARIYVEPGIGMYVEAYDSNDRTSGKVPHYTARASMPGIQVGSERAVEAVINREIGLGDRYVVRWLPHAAPAKNGAFLVAVGDIPEASEAVIQ